MFISNSPRFIFVHTPKTAGSTIHIHFKDYFGMVGYQRLDPESNIHHMSMDRMLTEIPDFFSYFSFMFVRDPISRFVSAYSEFKTAQHRKNHHLNILKYSDINAFVSDFLSSEWQNDVHFIPQHNFSHSTPLTDHLPKVSFIGKYENLSNDVSHIFQRIQLSPPSLSIKHRETPRDPATMTLNDSSLNILFRFYHLDYFLFNYKKTY